MLRLAESLTYEKQPATARRVDTLATAYLSSLKSLPAADLENKRREIENVTRAFQYLARYDFVAKDYAALAALERIIKSQGWDQKKK